MSGIVRKIVSCLANLCLCVVHALCRKKQQELEGDNRHNVRWSQGGDSDDKWNAEGWDDFSVKVVPNDVVPEQRPPGDLQAGEPPNDEQGTQQTEQDLFEDMKPVFRKPTKVHGGGVPVIILCHDLVLTAKFGLGCTDSSSQ